jgi:hypothetical protein
MPDPRKPRPTGFVATCRCGVVVGALDYLRSHRRESSEVLGRWLMDGCTVEPRFSPSWRVTVEACRCRMDFPGPPPTTRLHSYSVGEAKPLEECGKGHTLVNPAAAEAP